MSQDILITPKSGEPQILFRGSGVNDTAIELNVLSSYQSATGSGSALLFEGEQGQLFAITDNLSSGVIFSVADITGLPAIEYNASGELKLGEYSQVHIYDAAGSIGSSGRVLTSTGSDVSWVTPDTLATGTPSLVSFYDSDGRLGEDSTFAFNSGTNTLSFPTGVFTLLKPSWSALAPNLYGANTALEIKATGNGCGATIDGWAQRITLNAGINGVNVTNSFLKISDDYRPASVKLRVQGGFNQSANLQEWQNSSSTVLSYIDNFGNLTASGISTTGVYLYGSQPTSIVNTIYNSSGILHFDNFYIPLKEIDPAFTYASGLLVEIDYPTGNKKTFQYDSSGVLTSLQYITSNFTQTKTFSYYPDGTMSGISYT